MLVSKEELRFDFGSGMFDLSLPQDRALLAWILNQFLYGEVTGIQCGHWLYRAPSLQAATFLAKQAGEELAHVRKILRIFSLMGEKPGPAHAAVRFLSTGMMGGSWGEHVALEMALGEGLVLSVFYALVDVTRGQPEIHKILDTAAAEEERHVEFGERETREWLAAHPRDRKLLLGQAVVQAWALRFLKSFVQKRVLAQVGRDHPVLSRFDAFYDHALFCFELRIQRLGLCDQPLSKLSSFRRLGLVLCLPLRKLAVRLRGQEPLLTETYLKDPVLAAESQRNARPF